MTQEIDVKITKGLIVNGFEITTEHVQKMIIGMANIPHAFASSDLVVAMRDIPISYHDKQEALNRLFQRWRKLNLVSFKKGKWTLTNDSWDRFQIAVRNTKLA